MRGACFGPKRKLTNLQMQNVVQNLDKCLVKFNVEREKSRAKKNTQLRLNLQCK